jgi:DNA-binding XRE family transcriptional regulator
MNVGIYFGAAVRAAHAPLTQGEAALALGIPATVLSRIETGAKTPSLRQLVLLLRSYPVLYDALKEAPVDG